MQSLCRRYSIPDSSKNRRVLGYPLKGLFDRCNAGCHDESNAQDGLIEFWKRQYVL